MTDGKPAPDASNLAEGFLVEVLLDTPIVLSHPITLDALLARRMTDLEERFDPRRIPLARLTDKVWCGSQTFLMAPVQQVEAAFVRSTKPGIYLERQHLGLGPWIGKVETKRRDTANVLDRRTGAVCRSVVWWGRGNAAEVRRLTNGLREIGAKRAQGYGQVAEVRVEALGAVPPMFGAVMHDGSPARPLPRDWWVGQGGRGKGVEAVLAIGLPRWSAEVEEVVVPATETLWPSDLDAILAESAPCS